MLLFTAFVVASCLIIVVPGPSVMFVISRGVALGRKAALMTVLGNENGVLVQVLVVAAGLGVMLVPESLRHWRRPGVAYAQFRPKSGSLTLELVWRRDGPQPLVEAFVATARTVAENTPSGSIA